MPQLAYNTVTASQIEDASNQTNVPNYILAGMYKAGFHGDPVTLGKDLEHWYSASGGTSWQSALADYHAQSVQGELSQTSLDYGTRVLRTAETLPAKMRGAMSTSSALTLLALELGAGAAAGGAAAAGAGAVESATAGETAAAGTAAGAADEAGTASKGIPKAVKGAATAAGVGAAVSAAGNWQQIIVRLAEGAVAVILIALGLVSMSGSDPSTVLGAVR